MSIMHIIRERGGDDIREFRKALAMAKEGIATICDLAEEMEGEYSERRADYGTRYGGRDGYSSRSHGDWEEVPSYSERRYRY